MHVITRIIISSCCNQMDNLILVKHASGAPGLRLIGMGPNFLPQKGLMQLQKLFNENSFWAKKRSKKTIKKMLSQSAVITSIWQGKKLIAFGRATTDATFRSTLWDVVVDKNYQSLGIGKKIVDSLLQNQLVSKTEKTYVMTTHFENFYENIGFEKEHNQTLMIFKKPKSQPMDQT